MVLNAGGGERREGAGRGRGILPPEDIFSCHYLGVVVEGLLLVSDG